MFGKALPVPVAALAAAVLLAALPSPAGAATAIRTARPVRPPVYVPPVDYRAPIRAAIAADLELALNTREQVGAAYNAGQAEQGRVRAAEGEAGGAGAAERAAEARVARLRAAADRLLAAAGRLDAVIAELSGQAARLPDSQVGPAQAAVDAAGRDLQAAASAGFDAMWVEAAAALDVPGGDLRFGWPEDHFAISQGWGPSDLPGEPPFAGVEHFHLGYDLAAPEGTVVRPAADGVVVLVGSPTVYGRFMGFGNYVVVLHADGFDTLYGHLDEVDATPGDHVTRGTQLGLEGSTGYSTGPHLHFETHMNGVPVDSAPLFH